MTCRVGSDGVASESRSGTRRTAVLPYGEHRGPEIGSRSSQTNQPGRFIWQEVGVEET